MLAVFKYDETILIYLYIFIILLKDFRILG